MNKLIPFFPKTVVFLKAIEQRFIDEISGLAMMKLLIQLK